MAVLQMNLVRCVLECGSHTPTCEPKSRMRIVSNWSWISAIVVVVQSVVGLSCAVKSRSRAAVKHARLCSILINDRVDFRQSSI